MQRARARLDGHVNNICFYERFKPDVIAHANVFGVASSFIAKVPRAA